MGGPFFALASIEASRFPTVAIAMSLRTRMRHRGVGELRESSKNWTGTARSG